MNESSLKKSLAKINLGGLRYFDSTGSTNDEALAWAASGAADLSLVAADEQTRGRGRLNRAWYTPKGSALAFSLILRPHSQDNLSRMVGMAALAISDTLRSYGLNPLIKWPNDILLNGKKTAGILIETVWSGDKADSMVIGMGVNILTASVPPAEALRFPATSLEGELRANPPTREEILASILRSVIVRRQQLHTEGFLCEWQDRLAYLGEQVQIHSGSENPITGQLIGLEQDGSLRLRDSQGRSTTVRFGDVSLRPAA